MTKDEYYQELPKWLREYKEEYMEGEGIISPPDAYCFTHYIVNRLIVNGDVNNISDYKCFSPGTARYIDVQGRNLGEIHAFIKREKIIESDGENKTMYDLDLYFTHFVPFDGNDGKITTLHNEEFNNAANKIVGFYKKARTGNNQVAENAAFYDISKWINEKENEIDRINVCILTNCIVNPGTIRSRREKASNAMFYYEMNNIWDIDKIYHIFDGDLEREPIDVDFINTFRTKIPCVVSCRTDSYYTVLSVIPGKIVKDLYDSYQDKLLESNVRLFLGVQKAKKQKHGRKSKKPLSVNTCIRETLVNSPSKFMAYNNGISATGTKAEFEMVNSELGFITYIKDFQIVNGGQTTVSIYKAYKDYGEELELDKVFVSMKLTIVENTRDLEEDITAISVSSNRQNTVKFADFSSNNFFNRSLDRIINNRISSILLSKRQPCWFFDSKGQYSKKLNSITSNARKREFKNNFPKSQVFKKEDVASVWQAWDGDPVMSLASTATSYSSFINLHESEIQYWEAEDLIAMFILHRGITNSLTGDRKALLSYYIVALLHKAIPDFNLHKIYEAQSVPNDLKHCLIESANILKIKIKERYGLNNDIRNAMKTAECWNWVQTQDLLNNITDDIKSNYKYDDGELESRKNRPSEQQIELPQLDLHNRIASLGSNFWYWISKNDTQTITNGHAYNIYSKIRNQKIFSEREIEAALPVLDKYENNQELLDYISRQNENNNDKRENTAINSAYRFVEIDKTADWNLLSNLSQDYRNLVGDVKKLRQYLLEKKYSSVNVIEIEKIIKAYELLSRFRQR